MNDLILINRRFENIGWSDKLNFYDLKTGIKIKLKSYNGCLCLISDKRIGYRTFEKKSVQCKINIINDCPF